MKVTPTIFTGLSVGLVICLTGLYFMINAPDPSSTHHKAFRQGICRVLPGAEYSYRIPTEAELNGWACRIRGAWCPVPSCVAKVKFDEYNDQELELFKRSGARFVDLEEDDEEGEEENEADVKRPTRKPVREAPLPDASSGLPMEIPNHLFPRVGIELIAPEDSTSASASSLSLTATKCHTIQSHPPSFACFAKDAPSVPGGAEAVFSAESKVPWRWIALLAAYPFISYTMFRLFPPFTKEQIEANAALFTAAKESENGAEQKGEAKSRKEEVAEAEVGTKKGSPTSGGAKKKSGGGGSGSLRKRPPVAD